MTPAARINAAIELIDRIEAGALADRALAEWGRKNRYAGSKDRAAIADLVYDVLRQKRSVAALGGGHSGRAMLLGLLRATGVDPDSLFGNGPYAPAPLSENERAAGQAPEPGSAEAADLPEWVWEMFQTSLDDQAGAVADAMRARADAHLRVNLAKAGREQVKGELAALGILTETHDLSPTALRVTEGARKIRHSEPYLQGHVELQDAASQAVADLVPLSDGQRMLDYCAGGGGKTLAVAARVSGDFYAFDIDHNRMKDLPERAARAGAKVQLLTGGEVDKIGRFDTILIDAPCSGSGSWRRDPQGKWRLDPTGLARIRTTQRDILNKTAPFVASGGHLVYATCSLLSVENHEQVEGFLEKHPDFSLMSQHQFTPLDGGDRFYCAVLARKP